MLDKIVHNGTKGYIMVINTDRWSGKPLVLNTFLSTNKNASR
jgi:hypothetical protein